MGTSPATCHGPEAGWTGPDKAINAHGAVYEGSIPGAFGDRKPPSVAGSMIGSGIFIVSADIARQAGSPGWLLVVWVVTGLLTLMASLSYGELAAMMPKAGGQYVYLREAFSPLWGFLYGWTLFLGDSDCDDRGSGRWLCEIHRRLVPENLRK